jgi:hypothetical protein
MADSQLTRSHKRPRAGNARDTCCTRLLVLGNYVGEPAMQEVTDGEVPRIWRHGHVKVPSELFITEQESSGEQDEAVCRKDMEDAVRLYHHDILKRRCSVQDHVGTIVDKMWEIYSEILDAVRVGEGVTDHVSAPMPVIHVREADGDESILRYVVEGDVLHYVYDEVTRSQVAA